MQEVCPICKEPITPQNTTDIWFIISNQVGVPNRYVHAGCFTEFEETFQEIADDYERARVHIEWLVNSGWKIHIT